MPAAQREHPYIWATSLPRLLTSENSCEWAIWFKAHNVEWTEAAIGLRPSPVAFEPHGPRQRTQSATGTVGGFDVNVEAQN